MTESTPPVLSYLGRPDPLPPLPAFYRTGAGRWVIRCWAFPLGLEFVVFATYLSVNGFLFDNRPFDVDLMGLVDVLIGTAAALGGVAVTVAAVAKRWALSGSRGAEVIWPAVTAGALVASNLVLAVMWVPLAMSDHG